MTSEMCDSASPPAGESAVDFDLYSRQLGTYGLETMTKLVQLRVLISGLQGAGVETAKNLILAGPKSVTLHDETVVDWPDLGSNFYLRPTHVGMVTRAQGSFTGLRDLNPYVKVEVHDASLDEVMLARHDCVVLCNHTRTQLSRINKICREKGIGFIALGVYGLCCSIFVDFGPSFTVTDPDGEEAKLVIVEAITETENGLIAVCCVDDHPLPFSTGDMVQISEVQGWTWINVTARIKSSQKNTIFFGRDQFPNIPDGKLPSYQKGGSVRQVKEGKRLNFKSYDEATALPIPQGEYGLLTPDLGKIGRPEQLHICLQALMEYEAIHHCIPEARDDEASEEIILLAQKLNEKYKKLQKESNTTEAVSLEEVDRNLVKQISYFAVCHITPIAAFLGGVAAQEVVKLTGKYTPIHQWLYFDALELLNGGTQLSSMGDGEDGDFKPNGSRYDDQIILWGKRLQEQFANLKLFVVGAGALGCEQLKNLAMLGCGSGPMGAIVVTDMDRIEVSNLNRQFLFNRDNVGMAKSAVAAKAIKLMNPDINVKALELRVGLETEEELNDAFWDGLDVVVNALDNIPSRLYVDSKCVWHLKPLIESGTLGTKGNVQVIVPQITEAYGDSRDPPDESIPLCTLRHFPNRIEHTLEWARDLFQGTFFDCVQEAIKIITQPQKGVKNIKTQSTMHQRRTLYEKIVSILALAKSPSLDLCVSLAVELFYNLFDEAIAQLLNNFPADFVTASGLPFWSGHKRAPHVLQFDPDDEMTRLFLVSAAKLYANIAGHEGIWPSNEVVEKAKSYAKSVESSGARRKVPSMKLDEQSNEIKEEENDDETVCDQLEAQILTLTPSAASPTKAVVQPLEFEKDDDSNGHVDFVSAAGNLRARNYTIAEVDKWKAKMIAGKIVPAVATTTAMITGLACIELLKVVTGQQRKIEDYKNTFANLGISYWVLSEPFGPRKQVDSDFDPILSGPVRARPPGFTSWDKVEIKLTKNSLLKELVSEIEARFQTEVSILSVQNMCLYNGFFRNASEKLETKIVTILEGLRCDDGKNDGLLRKNYIVVQASCTDADSVDVSIPVIKCVLD